MGGILVIMLGLFVMIAVLFFGAALLYAVARGTFQMATDDKTKTTKNA